VRLTDAEIIKILETLTAEALRHKPTPSYGKIGTIKAMVDLGNEWRDYREIQRELGKYLKTGNVYVFDLMRIAPELIEKDDKNRVRIKPEVYPVVSQNINKYANKILKAIKLKKNSSL